VIDGWGGAHQSVSKNMATEILVPLMTTKANIDPSKHLH